MTSHTVSHTATRQHAAQPSKLAAFYRNWKARRGVRRLQDRSDEILDDIGVTRDEIVWASRLPLSMNAARELEKAAYRRRKEQQLMWL